MVTTFSFDERHNARNKSGGGAGHSNRNSSRWGNGGRRAPSFVGFERPNYETDGSSAKKPAPKPPTRHIPRLDQYVDEMERRAPLKKGTTLGVVLEKIVDGVKTVVAGMAEVIGVFWVVDHWDVRLKVNGIIMFSYLKLEEVLAGFIRWQKQRRQDQRSERMSDLRSAARMRSVLWTEYQPAPSLLMLPAPRTTIAGLLPARCA